MVVLLPPEILPQSFEYPTEYLRVVELGILEIEPWMLLVGGDLLEYQIELSKRYPERTLILIAAKTSNDDVACWDVDEGGVAIVHDYASPGWEQRGRYSDFKAWIRAAFDEFLDFE